MTDLRCWQCGVEPEDTRDLYTFDGQYVRTVVIAWPRGDHDHALTPPTPGDLLAAGARAADRVMEAWIDGQ